MKHFFARGFAPGSTKSFYVKAFGFTDFLVVKEAGILSDAKAYLCGLAEPYLLEHGDESFAIPDRTMSPIMHQMIDDIRG